jgi:hypothetical protein
MRKSLPKHAARPLPETVYPVSDAMLAQLLAAGTEGASALVEGLAEPTRARLAAFCYARTHMRSLGRAIAAHVGDEALRAVGAIGACLVAEKARDAAREAAGVPVRRQNGVTLARAAGLVV